MAGGIGTFYLVTPYNSIEKHLIDTKSTFITYEGKFNDKLTLQSNIGFVKRNFDLVAGFPNTKVENFLNKQTNTIYDEKILQGEIKAIANFFGDEKLRGIAGLQYKKADMKSTNYAFKTPNPTSDFDKTEKNISPFAQLEAKVTPYALFVLGIRHDSYDTAGKKMKATSPNFGVSIFPFAQTEYNNTTLWFGYSKAFNTPSALKRYLPKFWGGNPELNPEKAKGYELGLKQRISDWGNLEFSYYNTKYKDQIRLISLDSSWLFYNEGRSKVNGYEISSEFYPTDWLILNLAYSNSKTKDAKGQRLYGSVDKSIKYGATIIDLAGFDFSIQANKYIDLKFNTGVIHPSQNKTIIDAKLSYQYKIKDFTLKPFIEVENLTNSLYYNLISASINEGRNLRLGLNLRYDF